MSQLLSNKNIILRPLEPEDLEFLYTCENNTDIWHVSNTLTPFSKFILRQYIENSHHDIYTNKQLRLIISTQNEHKSVGAIDLFDFDPYHLRAGVGILINSPVNREKGYAFEALETLKSYCFSHLKLKQLYCNIGETNTKSIKLFEKAGFEKCGIKKQWLRNNNGYEAELMFQLIH